MKNSKNSQSRRVINLFFILQVIFISVAGFACASDGGGEPVTGLMIKEMLKKDFGYDLDIDGGSGQSRTDPLIVNSGTERAAIQTELQVLRGLNRGRGVYWRALECNIVDTLNGKVLQRKIETKEFQKEKIVSQIENYYFQRPHAPYSVEGQCTKYIIYRDPSIGVSFPSEMSWLHFADFVDYESSNPGLGYSLDYKGPEFNASVYVYPAGERGKNHRGEIRSAISDIEEVHGRDSIQKDWKMVERQDHSLYFFIPRYAPEDVSIVAVISARGYFVKVRMTYLDDLVIRGISQDFFVDLLTLVREGASTAN